MTDNVQPINAASTPSLPEVEPSPAPSASAGVTDLPDAPVQDPMPVWFKGLIALIVLIMVSGAYVGYLVVTKQISLSETEQKILSTPVAPTVSHSEPESTTTIVEQSRTEEFSSSVDQKTPQYQINLSAPVEQPSATPEPSRAVETVKRNAPLSSLSAPEVSPTNIETIPAITTGQPRVAISQPTMRELNVSEVLSEHSERLLALEGMAAEHAEVLSLMKDELQSTKQRLIKTDQNIVKVIKKIDGLTGKAVKVAATNGSKANSQRSSLPFKPLSYRTFGEQISVRVRAPSQKAQSLRIGQALSGWRLMSADPIARTAVFLNVATFKKQEVSL